MRRFFAFLAVGSLLVVSNISFAQDGGVRGLTDRQLRKLARKKVSASALKTVCKSISSILPGQMLVKSELSDHISNPGDARNGSYTLVCGNQCPRSFPASVFYSDGSPAARLGYYGTFSGNGRPRAYCGAGGAASCNARSISGIASRKRTGRDLYLQIDSARKVCKRFGTSGRYGGV